MRRTRFIAAVATVALVGACAPAGDDDRVAALQADLDTAQVEIDRLREANHELVQQWEDAQSEGPSDDPVNAEDLGTPAQLRSADGLVDQLRLLFPRPAEMPDEWEPATTDWEPYDLPSAMYEETFDSAGNLAGSVAQVLDLPMLGLDAWETVIRVLPHDTNESAQVAILTWGLADDAVEGRDFLIEVAAVGDTWRITDAQVRWHCRRGRTDDNLCI